MLSNFDFINFFFFSILIISVQIFLYIKTSKNKYFFDIDFNKPQAFHNKPAGRVGGLLIFIPLLIFFASNFFDQDRLSILLSFFIILNFICGFLDDCKLIHNPLIKFCILIFFITFFVIYNDLSIKSFGIAYVDKINNFYIFSIILTAASIFAVTNGANLIDGFNGLLLFNSFIISFFFAVLSYFVNEFVILKYCTFFCFILIFPLFLNFPKSRIFMGDSGAFVCGGFLAIIGIELSKNNKIAPFYIGLLLSYFALEVLFSIIRKICKKKNPYKPDAFHLHMLVYKFLSKFFFGSKKFFLDNNSLTSILISLFNLFYFFIGFFFFNDNLANIIIIILYIINYILIYFLLRKILNSTS
jgi:UDP-N-acetylmuramyl pentapeptide phosphotransferase/UDP-N-acetylglucosamine-1-phosphate transferase